MPPRRSPVAESDAEPEIPETDAEVHLKAFIDVFHEDWKALPLAARIAKIGGTLGNIPKRGWNPNQHYKFARETDLVAAIRPYLSAAGILITFSVTEHEILQRPDPAAKGMLTRINVHWTVTDGKEVIYGDMPGYGMDTGDKGVYKAITGAKKYILMTLFLIDTGDDPEAEKEEKPEQLARQVPLSEIVMRDNGERSEPVVTPSRRTDIVRGGHTTEATDTQRARFIEAIRIRGWSARQVLAFIRTELGAALIDAPEEDPVRLRGYISELLDSMAPSDMGSLLVGVERE